MNKIRKTLHYLVLTGAVIALASCGGTGGGGEDKPTPTPTPKKYLTALNMSGALDKVNYFVGDAFDPTGLVFTASYSDNTTKDVTSEMYYSVALMEKTTSFVKGYYTYEGNTMEKIIAGFSVSSVEFESFECEGKLEKSSYYEGETFSSAGLKFYEVFNNGTKNEVTNSVIFDKTVLTSDDTFVTATYKNKTIKIDIKVVKNELINLYVSGELIKKEYIEGDTIDLSGLTFNALFTNGKIVDVTSEITLNKTILSLGDTSLVATYKIGDQVKHCTVEGFSVIKNTLVSLSLSGQLAKTSYIENESLDLTGLTIYANFKNNTKQDVTSSVTLSKNKLAVGDTKVTAFYTYQDVTKNIQISGFTVVKNALVSLSVTGELVKNEYFEGDEIDLTGLTFTATYLNNSTKNVTNLITLSKTILTEDDNFIEASYEEDGISKSCLITGFVVTKNVLIDLIVSGKLTKTKYNEGETIHLDGLTFTAEFSSGERLDVTDSVVLSKTSLLEGETSIDVSYTFGEVTKVVTIDGFEVIKNVLTGLSYSGTLIKSSYIEGDKIDISGLTFTASYKDESEQNVTAYVEIDNETVSFGQTSFTVSYTEGLIKKSVTVTGINVEKNVLVSISASGKLQKATYDEGEPIDLTGLTFTATYKNGSTKDITNSITLETPVATLGATSTIVSYSEGGIYKDLAIRGIKVNLINTEDGLSFNIGKAEIYNKNAKYYIKDGAEPSFWTECASSTSFSVANLSNSPNALNHNLNSLHLKKDAAGQTRFYLGKDFIDSIGELGFEFDLYTSVAINSRSDVANLTDGLNTIIRPNGKFQQPNYQWIHYEFSKDRISSTGCFLITNGSSQGDYYFDNIRVITNNDLYTNAGTLYFKSNEPVSVHANKDLSKLNQVFLDGELVPTDKYSVNGSNIILSDDLFIYDGSFISGEYSITYNIKLENYVFEKETLYAGLYKASSKLAEINLNLVYGSGEYTELNIGSINKLVFNGKSIAYEMNGSVVEIPDASLVECLETQNNHKVSGSFTLFAVKDEYNQVCQEIPVTVTLSGDTEIKYQRSYSNDENYHFFGYSSTSGGSNSNDLIDADHLMLYERSGLQCVYEQYGSIPADIDVDSFQPGGAAGRIQREFELCNELGLDFYVIDYFMRNLVTSWNVTQTPIIGEGCKFASEQDFEDQIYDRLQYYAFNPCLKKLVICDEPNFSSMEVVGQIYRCTQKALARFGRPDIEVDANLLPLSAGIEDVKGSGIGLGPEITQPKQDYKNYPTRVATYRNYLAEFIKYTQANYISYDLYPLSDILISECAYSNLIVAAEFAKENGIELHVVSQSFTNCGLNSGTNTRVMDRDDMHFLLNMLMGFGVTRVSFFTYYARWNSSEFNPTWGKTNDRNGVIGDMVHEVYDENNNLIGVESTDTWYQVQGMLEEMNEFSDVSLSFSYVSCNFIKGSKINHSQEQGSLGNKKSAPLWAEQVDDDNYFRFGPLTGISVNVEYLLASTLVDKDGNYMYMVQNVCDPIYNSYQTVTMTFSSGNYAVIYENGTSRVVNLVSNKLTLKLSSGNAAFVMIY